MRPWQDPLARVGPGSDRLARHSRSAPGSEHRAGVGQSQARLNLLLCDRCAGSVRSALCQREPRHQHRLLRGGDTSAEPCSPSFVAIHRAYDWGVLMDERFESAVLIGQLVDGYGAGGWRRRRLVRAARWHLIDDERALTRCGIAFSYTSPRRPWRGIADDQRCQSCLERHERVSYSETSQTNLGRRAG